MIDEQTAVDIARKTVAEHAVDIKGFDSVRKISPRAVADVMERTEHPSAELLALLRARRDYWAVNFKLKVPTGEVCVPDIITVRVEDETGNARIEEGGL